MAGGRVRAGGDGARNSDVPLIVSYRLARGGAAFRALAGAAPWQTAEVKLAGMREMWLRLRYGGGWFLAGYAGLLGFFALEIATRRRGAASSLRTSTEDRGTTRRIGISYAVAAEGPLLLRLLPLPRLPPTVAALGLVLQAGGIALRTWSMRTLGASYTRTLRTQAEQQVIDTGPYRLLRHPGYAGSLLIWAGFALTSRSVLALPLVAGLLGDAYRRRIQAEELLLGRDLPGYAAYRRRTKTLIPFIW